MLLFAAQPSTTELSGLVRRLARLVQEMGYRGLEPEAYGPVPQLRSRYVYLLRQATHLAQNQGLAEAEAADYITGQLVEQLRTSSSTERRATMPLLTTLGE